jgi:hypothetical protein
MSHEHRSTNYFPSHSTLQYPKQQETDCTDVELVEDIE